MSKQQNKRIWDWNPKPRSVIIVGILLFLLVVLVHGHAEYQITASLARDTANTLRQQCISFYKLASGDRVKSLFRLSDSLLELSYHLRDDPELINDEYLEQSVDRLRLTGVALLDGDLSLEASGYTRPMQGSPGRIPPKAACSTGWPAPIKSMPNECSMMAATMMSAPFPGWMPRSPHRIFTNSPLD
ncbi:MAG: hypothetical protein ACLTY5_04680 [Angelakisella sp.]